MIRPSLRPLSLLALVTLLGGCPDTTEAVDAGRDAPEADSPTIDAGRPDDDAGADEDAGGDDDAGGGDAGLDGGCAPTEPEGACRSDADCTAGSLQCYAPGESIGCGICMEPIALCATDADCDEGDVCFVYTPPCSCGGDASECRPRCSASSCEEGETCDDVTGLCQPTRCNAGYACPAHTECVTKGGDAHGCERTSCTSDADCGCGACVEGRCYEALGFCSAPPA